MRFHSGLPLALPLSRHPRLCAFACALAMMGLGALLVSACGPESMSVDGAGDAAPVADDRPWVLPLHGFAPEEAPIFWEDENELRLTDEGVYRLFSEQEGVIELGDLEVWHVGLMIDAEALDAMRISGRQLDGSWTEEAPLEISWQEGYAHVAHAFFEAPVSAIRLVPGEARIAFALIEFFDSPPPPPVPGSGEQGEPVELPGEDPDFEGPEAGPGFGTPEAGPGAPGDRQPEGDGPLGTPKNSLIPPGGIPRADWGAVAPRCTPAAHTIRRLTVHHTATPNADSIDSPARMRQMQNYHMGPNLGWCDLGYHYVIGLDGNLYQGRNNPDRLGTHVGNHNSENLGLSMMGTYVSVGPSADMMAELEHALCWSAERYSQTLPRNRTAIRGHNEWPGHASNSCPGTMLRNQLDGLVAGICAPSCEETCTGGRRCVSANEYETCADHNGDGCRTFGGRTACGADELCDATGSCAPIPEPSEPSEPTPPEPSEPSEPTAPEGSASGEPAEGSEGPGQSAEESERAEGGQPSAESEGSERGDAAAPSQSAAAGEPGDSGADARAPGERRGEPGERMGDASEVVTTSGCSAVAGAPLGAGGGSLWLWPLLLLVLGRRRRG